MIISHFIVSLAGDLKNHLCMTRFDFHKIKTLNEIYISMYPKGMSNTVLLRQNELKLHLVC